MANKPLKSLNFGGVDTYTVYQKPDSGIPKTDLASVVQTSLNRANTLTDTYINGLIDNKLNALDGNGVSY